MTAADVGLPTRRPRPSCLNAIGVTSLSDADRELIIMTFGPAIACRGRRPQLGRAPAAVPVLVRPPLEEVDDLLVGVAAAVVADVDDDALLVPELIDFVLEPHERRLVHRLDVHVGDLAVRRLVHESRGSSGPTPRT